MNTYAVVVGILKFREKLLILKRGPDRSSSPNKWQFVSGHIKEGEPAEEAAIREIKEETGLKGKVVAKGNPLEIRDEWGRWIVIPHLVLVESDEVRIDRDEHTDYKWVKPNEIDGFDCIAGMEDRLRAFGI